VKKSAVQVQLEKIDAEIAVLRQVRDRLADAVAQPKVKRERKLKAAAPPSTRSLSETH
jgi:hypothetical protein